MDKLEKLTIIYIAVGLFLFLLGKFFPIFGIGELALLVLFILAIINSVKLIKNNKTKIFGIVTLIICASVLLLIIVSTLIFAIIFSMSTILVPIPSEARH